MNLLFGGYGGKLNLRRNGLTYPLGFKRASVNLLFGRYGEKLNFRRNSLSLHMRTTPGLFIFSFPGTISNEFSAHGCRLQSERALRRN